MRHDDDDDGLRCLLHLIDIFTQISFLNTDATLTLPTKKTLACESSPRFRNLQKFRVMVTQEHDLSKKCNKWRA